MKRPSQADRLLKLLSDGKEHRTDEIQQVVYGANHLGTARIASRADDLRKRGYDIPLARADRDIPSLSWYHINLTEAQKPKPKLVAVRTPNGVAMVSEEEVIRLNLERV